MAKVFYDRLISNFEIDKDKIHDDTKLKILQFKQHYESRILRFGAIKKIQER